MSDALVIKVMRIQPSFYHIQKSFKVISNCIESMLNVFGNHKTSSSEEFKIGSYLTPQIVSLSRMPKSLWFTWQNK